ncbi:SusD/RagB family nutrient-binding outer membrane lipoprotein [Aquimarina sp. MMG016]|uniref:SusD/RagB family nutrient-binding outer membrane lipoprotein n=1 Tax=Aquimarina sp. MMG016 TaxID=2822690 RepID=UPI001B39DD3C|nr:SusD/RagB family nutrient-binding outer membrane lipoprotein [Aquimarina sp. MMG016]MBQ4822722.1 SusD/RagB family nutrient-binding outer membrane lipoprotein [Aquimarina sp. MMG016]
MRSLSTISRKSALILTLLCIISCTQDFEEINSDPVDPQSASIEGIMAGVQYFEFAEPRFVTWRGNLIYTSQFSHQFSYNVTSSWFGADAYQNNQGWTNAVFDASYKKVSLNLRNLLVNYNDLGDQNGAAVARIMMSWFYQKMTDIFGNIPYSDVAVAELLPQNNLPQYNTQKDIYTAIIEDLKTQIDIIGSATNAIGGDEGDYLYAGDPQKWKAFANTLRLRMALRSRDAFIQDGEQAFIDAVITECLADDLIEESSQALLPRSVTPLELSNLDGGFEDIYHGFGETLGPKWVFTERYLSLLEDNNDPRLSEVAEQAPNGGYGGSFIGSRTQAVREDMAIPSAKIIGLSTTDVASLAPIQVVSAAESYFLQAEAAVLGYGGDANTLYQMGIRASMEYWGVSSGDADNFIMNETIAQLIGSTQENLESIWNQRWLAALTNGYESWALVRRTNLIDDLTDNALFFVTQPNNGIVPRRLPYSSTELVSNAENVNKAIQQQGPDEMSTNIWWDID